MTLDYERILNWPVQVVEQTWTEKDTILYALGIGLGINPIDEKQLRYVYEDGLQALPTMATVLGSPGFWLKEENTGVDWRRVLHGEQGIVLHRPLSPTAKVVGRTRVTDIVDKGKDKGALIYQQREVDDRTTGERLATLTMTTFCRGDGGFDGPSGPIKERHRLPERDPDMVCDLPTVPQAALIYRLSGDRNPLHADPAVARQAGFARPILHGLCTVGIAGHAIIKTCCDYRGESMRSMDVRFSAPMYPGETLRTEMWRDGVVISFRSRIVHRNVVVLDNGRAELTR